MNDIMKIVKSLKTSGVLIKGVSERIKNKAKERKGGFRGMLLGFLGDIILGNLKAQVELVKAQLEQARVFNAACTVANCNKYWIF